MTTADYITSSPRRKPFTIVPDPFASDRDFERFQHLDIRQLAERALWAEKRLVDLQLARLIAYGRPRLIFCLDEFVRDQDWLEERSRRLQAELRRRRR